MILVDCVAILYTQGVGRRKRASIVIWECYVVSPRRHFSLGSWLITKVRVEEQIGLISNELGFLL